MITIRDLLVIPLLALALSPAAAALREPVTPESALAVAKAKMYAQYPELDHPQVKILSRTHGSKTMKLVFSNPFSLNGETFWSINTQYIWYGDPRIEYHYVGLAKGPKDSPTPGDATVDPAIREEVIRYLAYLNAQASLNPGLRTGAAPTTVHLFTFYRKAVDPMNDLFKIVGVDDTGATFHPNSFSTLVPKPWTTMP